MADEFSTREDMEKDLQNTKDTVNSLTKPLREHAENEIGDRIAKTVADQAARAASQAAAETAAASGAGAMAGTAAEGATAAGEAAAGVGGTTATTAVAEATAGAGSTVAAGEAAATAASAGGAAAASVVAEGAAAGSAGGPIGVAIGAVVGIAVALGTAIHKEMQISLDKDNPDGPKVSAVTLFVCMIGFMIVFCGVLLTDGIVSCFSIGQETEFEADIVNGAGMAPAGDQYKDGTELQEYNYKQPLKNVITTFIYGPNGNGVEEGQGVRSTLNKAIREHCHNIIKQLEKYKGKVGNKTYDDIWSLSSFYQNPWPYDVGSATYIPLIGDVLIPNQEYNGIKYKSWNPRFDDVNYAEILSIMGMSATAPEGATYGLHWGQLNYNDFMAYLQKEECYKYMYELGLKWVPIYEGTKVIPNNDGTTSYIPIKEQGDDEYDSPEACATAPQEKVIDGVTCEFTRYFVKVTVKPFGLRELFAMAFNTTDYMGAANQLNVDFYEHKNIDILDYQERVTRLYQRGQTIDFKVNGAVVGTGDALGPKAKEPRSIYSPIYNELINDSWLISRGMAGTGRSAWYYIEVTYNDDLSGIEWDAEPTYEGDYNPDDLENDLKKTFGSSSEKLAELFPDGIPQTEEEMQKYLVQAQIECLDFSGNRVTRTVTVHKALVPSIQAMFKELADSGFIAYDVGGYDWRSMATSSNRSHHSYGVAIDINVADNPMIKNDGSKVTSGNYDPAANPNTTLTSEQAKIFNEYGWTWGGDWKSSKDYMHISYTGY